MSMYLYTIHLIELDKEVNVRFLTKCKSCFISFLIDFEGKDTIA